MAMQKSKRQELRKSRELLRFLLDGYHCCFCKVLLIPKGKLKLIGKSDGEPITGKITIHHVNNDHRNNRRSNLRLAHTTCHKRFHMRMAWKLGWFGAKQGVGKKELR